jgi:hypothetical protein
MHSRAAVRLFRIAAFFSFAAGPMFGWGCEGHQMIALIARAHLSSPASSAVDQLLRRNPIDPALSRFCKDRPDDLMADASTWADDARIIEKTSQWHFVDIPLSVIREQSDISSWCPPVGPPEASKDRTGCIVTAIEYEWGILRDASRPEAERAKALRYIIHFISDLHQPLHDTDNNDRGGNCTAITFFAEDRPANLHAIWDYKLIEREMAREHQTQLQFAAALDHKFSQRWSEWRQPKVDVLAWAWEGHAIAHDVTYGDLHPQIPVETPNKDANCDLERDKVAALHISVSTEYSDLAESVIEQQLAKAGYRLAALLNQTFGQ